MTPMSKKELIKAVKPRYLRAGKQEKTAILDEFCQNAGYNRKYAIQILQSGYDYRRTLRQGRKPRPRIYDSRVLSIVIKIWELLEYPCGARLQPMLVPMLEALERFKEISVSDDLWPKLKAISSKTLDRRLSRERKIRKLNRFRGTTRHGSLLKSSVPVRITNWDADVVGFMEMDTVAHNGGDPSGEHIYSLDMVEISSGWSEQIAVMGKGEVGVVLAVNEVKSAVPFDLKGLDSDSGSESSIGIWCGIATLMICFSPDQGRIGKTTMLTWNKRTIPTSGNGWATAGTTPKSNWPPSTTCTETNCACSIISSGRL